MKSTGFLAVVLSALALAGCAGRYYDHDGYYHDRYGPGGYRDGYYSNRDYRDRDFRYHRDHDRDDDY